MQTKMLKIDEFINKKQDSDHKLAFVISSSSNYHTSPDMQEEITKVEDKKTAFYNDIKNKRDFDGKIKDLFSAEFEDKISSILLMRESEFMSSILRGVKSKLEMMYTSDIFDEKLLKETFDRCEKQFRKEIYAKNHKTISTSWNDYEINLQAIKKYSSSKDKVVNISTKNQEIFSFLKSFRKHCKSTDSLAYHNCKIGAKMLEVHDKAKEGDAEKGEATHVICTECKCCYFANRIELNCNHCSTDYCSSVLEIGENPDIQPATWSKYHCGMLMNDKMRCIKCSQVLYLNLKSDTLTCLNRTCKFEAKSKSIMWVCVMCKKEFNSDAKVYNPLDFMAIKNAIQLAISLKQRARPSNVPCCDLNINSNIFYHKKECPGEVFQGLLDKKPIVVCGKCKSMNFYEKYLWTCPQCKRRFQDRKAKESNLDCSFAITGHINSNESRRESNKNYFEKDFGSMQERLVTPKLSVHNRVVSNLLQHKNALLNSNSTSNQRDDLNNSAISSKIDLKNLRIPKKHRSLMDILQERKSSMKNETLPDNLIKLVKNSEIEKDLNNELFLADDKRKESSLSKTPIEVKSDSNKDCSNHGGLLPEELVNPIKKVNELDLKEINESNTCGENFINSKIEDFTIIKQIGQGSYGKIYLIEDKSKRQFAMKKIIAHDPDELVAIRKEFELLNSIKHDNIMKIYGIMEKTLDKTTYALYIIMEKAIRDWDEEIKDRLERKLPYTEEELFNIIRQLIEALAFLQKNKISHRDIKPMNILVFDNNVYKIGDFGEAKEIKLCKQLNSLRGTEIYMSPILFESLKENKEDVTHNVYKSDAFSLGYCLLYAATLSFQSITEVRDLKNMKSTIVVLNKYLNTKYSSKLICLLVKMIDVYERTRYDFVDLVNYLKEKIFSG